MSRNAEALWEHWGGSLREKFDHTPRASAEVILWTPCLLQACDRATYMKLRIQGASLAQHGAPSGEAHASMENRDRPMGMERVHDS